MVNDDVVAMLVVHVDDIKIIATKEMTDSVVADLNKRFLTKHLHEVTWYMGSSTREIVRREPWRFHRLRLFETLSNVSESQKPSPSPLLRHWTSGT